MLSFFSLYATLNWQIACQFSSSKHLSYRIVSQDHIKSCIGNHVTQEFGVFGADNVATEYCNGEAFCC